MKKITSDTMQLKLEQAKEIIDQFIYSCSHSLKSPLTTIEGLLMVAENGNISDVRDCMTKIHNCVAGMYDTLRSLEACTVSAQSELCKEEIQAEQLVEQVLSEYDEVIEKNAIQVITKIEQDHSWVADAKSKYLILKSLIGNAIQFRDTEKKVNKIRIEVAVKKDTVKLNVLDNGIGIPAKEQNKIFIPFHRSSTQSNGNGLGLFLVKELAEKLNASVSMLSDEKIGTSFFLSLPNQHAA